MKKVEKSLEKLPCLESPRWLEEDGHSPGTSDSILR